MDKMALARRRRGRHCDQFRPKRTQRIHFFPALGFGHDDGRFIAFGIGDQRDTDSGITGRPFDNPSAGLEQPPLLGILNDVQRGTVFDRGAGIGKFALAINIATRFGARASKADKRGYCRSGRDYLV